MGAPAQAGRGKEMRATKMWARGARFNAQAGQFSMARQPVVNHAAALRRLNQSP